MKKENDEITDLFRTRLADAGMTVRDGFWEELSQDIPVACQHRRRLIFFRVAAAASVLLVLAASSATSGISLRKKRWRRRLPKSWWRTAEEWMEMVYALISCRRQWNLYCRNRHLNHSDYYRSIRKRETRFPFPSPCLSLLGNYHHGKWQPIRQPRSQRLLAGE